MPVSESTVTQTGKHSLNAATGCGRAPSPGREVEALGSTELAGGPLGAFPPLADADHSQRQRTGPREHSEPECFVVGAHCGADQEFV